MTRERTTADALDGKDGGLAPLHFGALCRWLDTCPEHVRSLFGMQVPI
ncbi:hypothetical protein [Hyalangium versicolor]|nr:hypothetical protein [Hyalangium versicolor]